MIGGGIRSVSGHPDLLSEASDNYTLPLQLLARELEFVDPLSGIRRRFVTGRTLSEAPTLGR